MKIFRITAMWTLPLLTISAAFANQPATTADAYAGLPLGFEPNVGQADAKVIYLAHGLGYLISITRTGIFFQRTGAEPIEMSFEGGSQRARIEAMSRLPGFSNYLLGPEARSWRTNIPTFSQLAVRNIYPGVDIIFYGTQRQFEYDLVLAQGARPDQIRLKLHGAGRISRDSSGDLLVRGNGAQIRLVKPATYQVVDGGRRRLASEYLLLRHGEIGFRIPDYDASRPLVIDPLVLFSTYLGGGGYFGGGGNSGGYGIALDLSGNIYISGQTNSPQYPTVGSLQAYSGAYDAFVTKLNPQGTSIIYSTYLGGAANDIADAIAVGGDGTVYITGTTAGGFPIANAYQPNFAGAYDAFVTAINPQGNGLVYSTYLGGNGVDAGYGIAVDSGGNAYVAGLTSGGIPLVNPLQPSFGGGPAGSAYDAFVAKLGPQGSVLYSTYLGGSGADAANAIAIDSIGSAYVAGLTSSSGFPTTGSAPQTGYGGGAFDAFVAKLDPTGSAIVYATYLGGMGGDEATGIAIDQNGAAHVTGYTTGGFPMVNAYQPNYGGGPYNAFIATINPAGAAVISSSYLGLAQTQTTPGVTEIAYGIALDAAGNSYITGCWTGVDCPGSGEAFVLKLPPGGAPPAYVVNLVDYGAGYAVAANPAGTVYVTGLTGSPFLPVISPLQGSLDGTVDGFVASISANDSSCIYSLSPPASINFGYTGGPAGIYVTQTAGQRDVIGPSRTIRAGYMFLEKAPASGMLARDIPWI